MTESKRARNPEFTITRLHHIVMEANIESSVDEAYKLFSCPMPPELLDLARELGLSPGAQSLALSARAVPLHLLRQWFSLPYEPYAVPQKVWRYLLPRVLEALAADEWPDVIALEVTLNRFETGNPDRWSTSQWQVLDRFQRAYIERSARRRDHTLDAVLCMFRLGGWALERLLAQVSHLPDDVLFERLWHDWCADVVPGREAISLTSFWPHGDRPAVAAFYCSDAILERAIALALADRADPSLARKAAHVAETIEKSRKDHFQAEQE